MDPIPTVLSQPCCAQFALSKERIQALPLSRYIFYRDWLLRTPLSDYFSGRIWEYLWQYVFTGEAVVCPEMSQCYCDGYGICFGGPEKFNEWFELRYVLREHEGELSQWRLKQSVIEDAKLGGTLDEVSQLEVPEVGRDEWLMGQIGALRDQLQERKYAALEQGRFAEVRAQEAGRPYRDGDSF